MQRKELGDEKKAEERKKKEVSSSSALVTGPDPAPELSDKSQPPLPDIPLPPPSTIPTEILTIDKDTPDSHVPRDPRLIRLTGVHPFNVEAPLTDLYNEGWFERE